MDEKCGREDGYIQRFGEAKEVLKKMVKIEYQMGKKGENNQQKQMGLEFIIWAVYAVCVIWFLKAQYQNENDTFKFFIVGDEKLGATRNFYYINYVQTIFAFIVYIIK